ncbi:MAG: arsenite methyltransferase [Candidatus Thorarchaeota archaeon]
MSKTKPVSEMTPDEIKIEVKKKYSEVAQRKKTTESSGCCGPSEKSAEPTDSCECDSSGTLAEHYGYSIEGLPESVFESFAGCGNPVAVASLIEGEVVLDLGSGAGLDMFVAAKKVGKNGRVIGVDMTDDMLQKARKNAEKLGITNVEFRKGDIEELPVEDDSIDVIISNCVINLAPNKDKVFREAFRVLRPGGRMMISDVVLNAPLPKKVRDEVVSYTGCIGGAILEENYLQLMRDAGFEDVKVVEKAEYATVAASAKISAFKPK